MNTSYQKSTKRCLAFFSHASNDHFFFCEFFFVTFHNLICTVYSLHANINARYGQFGLVLGCKTIKVKDW